MLGLAQICVGNTMINPEDLDDISDDDTSTEPLTKKLEFMFRIYDLDR